MTATLHTLHPEQPDECSRRDAEHAGMRALYIKTQREADASHKAFADKLASLAIRRRALDEEEASARRLHAQESSALKARLSRQQAYLDASQEHGIAAE